MPSSLKPSLPSTRYPRNRHAGARRHRHAARKAQRKDLPDSHTVEETIPIWCEPKSIVHSTTFTSGPLTAICGTFSIVGAAIFWKMPTGNSKSGGDFVTRTSNSLRTGRSVGRYSASADSRGPHRGGGLRSRAIGKILCKPIQRNSLITRCRVGTRFGNAAQSEPIIECPGCREGIIACWFA